MISYQIELETRNTVRLIKDTNAKAAHPFDGGSIFHGPEAYPARLVEMRYGDEITSVEVNNSDEWKAIAERVVRDGRLAA